MLAYYISSLIFKKQWVENSDNFLYADIDGDNRITLLDENKNIFLVVSDFGLIDNILPQDYLKDEKLFLSLYYKIKKLEEIENIVQCNL